MATGPLARGPRRPPAYECIHRRTLGRPDGAVNLAPPPALIGRQGDAGTSGSSARRTGSFCKVMVPRRNHSESGARRGSRRRAIWLPAVPLAFVVGGLLGVLAMSGAPVRDMMADRFSDVAEAFSSASLDVSPDYSVERPIGAMQISVIDGDTVRIEGRSVRLVGFNAPETRNAECTRERNLGLRATARVRDLVGSGSVAFVEVACACTPGTAGTQQCNYGRACGTLKVAGRDVGDLLIAEGLAVPFVCGETRCPPTPRPWCST